MKKAFLFKAFPAAELGIPAGEGPDFIVKMYNIPSVSYGLMAAAETMGCYCYVDEMTETEAIAFKKEIEDEVKNRTFIPEEEGWM